MKKKELYTAPETEVLELHLENSVLVDSANPGGTGNGFDPEIG